MQITEVVVSAGRTFNNPREDYSNLKPHVTVKATIAEGEDPVAVAKQLQVMAEQLVEDQKQNMLKAIEDTYQLGQAKAEMVGLARQLHANQERLDDLRKQWPMMAQLTLSEKTSGE